MLDIQKNIQDVISQIKPMTKYLCGKCTPCRIGTKRMVEILESFLYEQPTREKVEQLIDLAKDIKQSSKCKLGRVAPNLVFDLIKNNFDENFDVDDEDDDLVNTIRYEIDKTKCVGCSLCARNCPVKAISGELKKPFIINQDKCVACGLCKKNCKFNAVQVKEES